MITSSTVIDNFSINLYKKQRKASQRCKINTWCNC